MKQILFSKSILMGAALLAGTAMFTACSSDEVIPENVNPTFDGESVKTQFAISIPAAGPKKKMTPDNTQQGGTNFLGMQNIRLIPYASGDWTAALPLNKILALDNIATVSPSGNETQKIYTDVDIPVGTDRFLFYGVEIGSDKVQNGSLIPTIDGQANRSGINFELEQIHDGTTMTEQTLLVGLLNRVKNTTGWSAYITETTAEDKAIKKLYTDFITMNAGSASSILNLMQSLYRSLSFASNDGGASDAAKMAYNIRQAITTDIGGGLTLKVERGTSGEETLTYNSHEGFEATFPANYKLPDGAVRVKSVSGVDFTADNNSYEVGGTDKLKIENITYPASLYYFCQSELKASTSTNVTFPTNGNWGSETSWTGWEQTEVAATTRSIAMVSPVNYGVGMLATTVKCASENLIDAGDNTIAIGTNGFTLTGVLIGGQPDDVQWNMYQAYANTSSRTKTIYDAAIPATNPKVTTTSCDVNYTLALDNSKFTDSGMGTRAGKDSQDKVNIAIELVNNTGKNFEGADGIIYAGSKFYLVAQLDPNGTSVTNDDKKSVFMKDYKTTATLTISSLKNAYNGIPDLRSTSLQFGLAVNLEWQTGLSFDVSIE